MADSVGMKDIRGLNITKAVTGFALREYKFKDLCFVESVSSWQDRYYQETAADLSAADTSSSVQGVPRLSAFPSMEPTWTQVNSYMIKHAATSRISWEDAKSNDVDVVRRTLLRIGRAVAKSVDANIWNTITENQSASNINSVTIAVGSEWDSATIGNRDPIDNILAAKQAIEEQDYNAQNAVLLLSPKDYRNLMTNSDIKNSARFYSSAVTQSGRVESICGLNIIVSNNVTADYAAVVIPNEAATWKQLEPMTVRTIEDAGIGYSIRAWETGVCQLKNPKAVCLIVNTQA